MLSISVLFCALLAAEDKPVSKIPIGKDTTYITEPLDSDGYIDYETALNERLRKNITPDKNAVVSLWQAIEPKTESGIRMPPEYFKWLGTSEPPDRGDYLIGYQVFLKDHARIDMDQVVSFIEQLDKALTKPWKATDYPHIANWLKANEKPLAIAIEASKRPEYYNPLVAKRTDGIRDSLVSAQLLNVLRSRDFANALAARAMLKVGEGKPDEAWQDLVACHRLGRLTARGGEIIEALAGLAINKIAINAEFAFAEHAILTGEQMRKCLKDLQSLPPLPGPADKIDLTGRFTYLDCAQFVRRGGVRNMERWADVKVEKKTPDSDEEKALAAIDWQTTFQEGNQYYDRLVAALRITNRVDREKEFNKLDNDLRSQKNRAERMAPAVKMLREGKDPGKAVGKAIGNMLVGLLSPNVRRIQDAYDRAEQLQRNLHVAFALAAYRRENGRYPAKLDELVPKYLPGIPDDLFSDKPPMYRASDTGFVLYSVGVNGKDNLGLTEEIDYNCDDLAIRAGDQAHDYIHRLQGTWEVLSLTEDGEDLSDEKIKGRTVTFDGNKMISKDGAGTTEVVTFKLDTSKTPVWFDTQDGQNAPVLGLLYLGSDGLGICSFKSSDKRPTEMKCEKGSKAVLLSLRRPRK